MPEKLKKYFNRKYKDPFKDADGLTDDEIMSQLSEGDSWRLSNIIYVFSEILSKKIDKSLIPTAGLMRLAVKDTFPQKDDYSNLSFKEVKEIFSKGLKERLKKISIENVEELIEEMLSELKKHQSLFTMARV